MYDRYDIFYTCQPSDSQVLGSTTQIDASLDDARSQCQTPCDNDNNCVAFTLDAASPYQCTLWQKCTIKTGNHGDGYVFFKKACEYKLTDEYK